MVVSMSAAVFLLILLIRKSGLRPTHAVVSAFLGFYLARSQFAPTTQDLTSNAADCSRGSAIETPPRWAGSHPPTSVSCPTRRSPPRCCPRPLTTGSSETPTRASSPTPEVLDVCRSFTSVTGRPPSQPKSAPNAGC